VEVPHFDGTGFVSWKYQMSSYLHEMNPQIWWMIDIGLSQTLEDFSQIQRQKKCLYLKAHASNALSSALSVETKDEIEMEYSLFERANILWKVLEQMYSSSNSKRSSSSALENISSSSTHFDQDQEEHSSVQEEELNSTSLGKSDGLVSQTGVSILAEQKLSWLKKMIAPRHVSMMTVMMMILKMNMTIKSSWWSLRNSELSI
jgi:hypothetical protein